MRSQFVIALICLLAVVFGPGASPDSSAGIVYEGDAVFIVDRTGEKWDITQAVSIGFDPRGSKPMDTAWVMSHFSPVRSTMKTASPS